MTNWMLSTLDESTTALLKSLNSKKISNATITISLSKRKRNQKFLKNTILRYSPLSRRLIKIIYTKKKGPKFEEKIEKIM